MEFIIIYCSVPNRNEGKEIARALVESKAAACVNILDKMESIFSWDGEIMDEKEALLMIKTKREHFENVNRIIQKLHSYNVPEVIAVPILDADDTYLKWIAHETR